MILDLPFCIFFLMFLIFLLLLLFPGTLSIFWYLAILTFTFRFYNVHNVPFYMKKRRRKGDVAIN